MIDKDLLRLLGKDRYLLFETTGAMLIVLLSNIAISFSLCFFLYLLLEGNLSEGYVLPLVLLVVALPIRFLFAYWRDLVKERLGRNVRKRIRTMAYDKILAIGESESRTLSLSGLTQVTMEGVEQLDLYYSSYLPQFFYALLAPVVLFLVLVFVSWRASLVLLCLVPLIPMSIVLFSKYAKRIFAKYWGKYISMGDSFLDSIQGLKELKVFDADGRQEEKIRQSSEEFRKVTMKVLVMQLFSTTIMDLIAYGGVGLGIAMAILDMEAGTILPIAALFVVLEAVEFFLPMRAFGSAFHVAMNGLSAGKKILALLGEKEEEWGKAECENGDLVLEQVTFSYDGKKDILQDVDLTIGKGRTTAIVGQSGSGKSTIVKLLLGERKPQKGRILLGGKDIRTLSRESLYDKIALVSTDSYLFHESIRDNFHMAKKNLSDEEIVSMLRKVRLDSFLERHGGLDYVLTEDSRNVSGGEKQRLALAIALLSDKAIYLFDEATSNIDVESERIIMEQVLELKRKGKAVLLISHRLENVVPSDTILFLKDGRILEEGTHGSLMEKDGVYAHLYRKQKDLEEGHLRLLEERA